MKEYEMILKNIEKKLEREDAMSKSNRTKEEENKRAWEQVNKRTILKESKTLRSTKI
jgi:hypothetical protein